MMRAAILACVLVSIASGASANPVETFGFGARGPAFGNAMVAYTDGASSAIYNIAGAASVMGEGRELRADGIEVAGSFVYQNIDVNLSGRGANLMDAHGFDVGATLPVQGYWGRFALALALHLPNQFIARVHILQPTEPQLVLWDNRPHRLVFNAGAAFSFGAFSFGAGVTLLADAGGPGVRFITGSLPGRAVADAAIDVNLPIRIAPVLGVLLTPTPELRFGARYTGEISLDVTLPVLASTSIPGTDFVGDIAVRAGGTAYFTPQEVTLGASFSPGNFTFAAELAWLNYGNIKRVGADLFVDIDLRVPVPVDSFQQPAPGFRDVFTPRFGGEYRHALSDSRTLALRCGYWFAPSPVPEQRGITSYADADRHVATLGAALTLKQDLPFEVRVETALQGQFLASRVFTKDVSLAAAAPYSVSGFVWGFSVGVGVTL